MICIPILCCGCLYNKYLYSNVYFCMHMQRRHEQNSSFRINVHVLENIRDDFINIVVACLCPSVSPSVTKFVRAITHHPFKLGSLNLNHRCKRPWLRSLLFFAGDWPWPSRSNSTSKSKFTPFWACPRDNSSPVQARATQFGSEVLNTLVKIPVVLGVDWAWHVKFNLFTKSCLFASLLRLWNIWETCKNEWNGVCSTIKIATHIYVCPQKRVMDRGTVGLYI